MSIAAIGFNSDVIKTALLLLVLFSVIVNFVLLDKIGKMKKISPLTTAFAEASKTPGRPVGVLVDKSGTMTMLPAETSHRNAGLLDHDKYILVKPDFTKSSTKNRFIGGPDMVFYSFPGVLPVGFHESAALIQLAEKIRGNDELNWLPSELDVICLIFDDPGRLLEDCTMMVSETVENGRSIPEIMMPNDEDYNGELTPDIINEIAAHLVESIKDMHEMMKITPIKCEPVYLSEAAELCNVGTTGIIVSSLLSLQEQGDRAEKLDFFDKHKDLIIVIACIFAMPLLYYIVMHFIG